MMKVFGEQNMFSIKYEFKKNPFNESGILGESWGSFELWIDNKNIFKYVNDNGNVYEWNLIYIVKWFIGNFKLIISQKNFPLEVLGKNVIEKYINSGEFDSENEEIFDEWYEKRFDWYSTHCLYYSRAGSYMPQIFFFKNKKVIEIFWDNLDLYENVEFFYLKGNIKVSIEEFERVVKTFLIDFIQDLSNKPACIKTAEELKRIFFNEERV